MYHNFAIFYNGFTVQKWFYNGFKNKILKKIYYFHKNTILLSLNKKKNLYISSCIIFNFENIIALILLKTQ